MDERKAYWFEQPYMPRMKNIAVAPVILEDGRIVLPLAVQVHHAVCDGFHICRFVNELQELINS